MEKPRPIGGSKQARNTTTPTVILAGGINRIALADAYRPSLKALVPFAGKPSIRYVAEALRQSSRIGPIAVVGSEQDLRQRLTDIPELTFLRPGKTLLESLTLGVEHFAGHPSALITTADLPLLTASVVDEFLDVCRDKNGHPKADLQWAMIPREAFSGPFARVAKGFNRFRDVAVCHGNLILIDPAVLENFAANTPLEALYRARKSTLRTALNCGWKVASAYFFGVLLLRRLKLEDMARVVSRRFGVRIVPVLLPHPEAALDVDEPEDFRLVNDLLQKG